MSLMIDRQLGAPCLGSGRSFASRARLAAPFALLAALTSACTGSVGSGGAPGAGGLGQTGGSANAGGGAPGGRTRMPADPSKGGPKIRGLYPLAYQKTPTELL